MAAIEPFCNLIGLNSLKLTREENVLVEAELLNRVYEELKQAFREKFINYFRLMKFSIKMENTMLEVDLMKLIIKDILSTGEYTLDGVATYADIPEDVLCEVMTGRITNPSVAFFRKIIELHKSVRREVYAEIMKKIALEYITKCH